MTPAEWRYQIALNNIRTREHDEEMRRHGRHSVNDSL